MTFCFLLDPTGLDRRSAVALRCVALHCIAPERHCPLYLYFLEPFESLRRRFFGVWGQRGPKKPQYCAFALAYELKTIFLGAHAAALSGVDIPSISCAQRALVSTHVIPVYGSYLKCWCKCKMITNLSILSTGEAERRCNQTITVRHVCAFHE